MLLPGMAVISELIASAANRRPFGYEFIAGSSIAIALLSFLVWGHHMFVSGQSMYAGLVFGLLSFTVAVPSAVKVYNWTMTLRRGSVRADTPLLYALTFIWLFVFGGPDGAVPRQRGDRRPRPRHLLRGRAFPLHHGPAQRSPPSWAESISGGPRSPGGSIPRAGAGPGRS